MSFEEYKMDIHTLLIGIFKYKKNWILCVSEECYILSKSGLFRSSF